MKLIAAGILVLSVVMILYIWITKRIGFAWITRLGLHFALAAVGIYAVNIAGVLPDVYIPLNPATIGTVLVLGLPGVGLLIGLKLTWI
ncbi:pro-sigmaK processing inhibitor BofA [Paenibacillus yonginensis]|uniref:Pro-sigmaK processing inhibitor BofA n=1 Tax=Paenibacillus yonginensis TaxID=1462996 RepID=A0A1B1N4D4_9BACL|nr:pro-sigmaK processing inhibitor BofA family protein [Paenibacillus yonginensis]ANS76301.1 pro-sigmaK processing inhibitor BofA [Paenibacillus yonginensis]